MNQESQQLGRIEQMVKDMHDEMPKVQKRVGSLERSRSYAKGAAAVFTVCASAAWAFFK